MSSQTFVAGMGIVSAIGNGLLANLQSLSNERTGISEMKWLSVFMRGTSGW
jgi:hypothetical protein